MMISSKITPEVLQTFIPLIVKTTLAVSVASAFQRNLTGEELDQIISEADNATSQFMQKYEEMLQDEGTEVSGEELQSVGERVRRELFEIVWQMIETVTEELKIVTG